MADEKKELFSETVSAGSRVYVFDVKESKEGTRYLVIRELRKTRDSNERYRVMIFQENLDTFCVGFQKALAFLGIENKPKANKFDAVRRKFPKAYQRWTTNDDETLRKKYAEGLSIAKLAEFFQRQPSAIESRLVRMGLKTYS